MPRIQFSIRVLLFMIGCAAICCVIYSRFSFPEVAGKPAMADLFNTGNTAKEIRAFLMESTHPVDRVILNGNLVNDDSIKGFGDYRHVKNISVTFFRSWCGTGLPPTTHLKCALTDRAVERLVRLQALEELHLPQTEITDDGISQLAQLPNLRKLSVAGNDITATGFAPFPANCKLEELDISRTLVSDSDLANIGHLGNLRILRCNKTQVTADGLSHLLALKNLEEIHVPTDGLSFRAVYRFFQAL